MWNVPALEIGTIHLTTHDGKVPAQTGDKLYTLVFKGYSTSYHQLTEKIKNGENLSGKMWIDKIAYPGKIVFITPYVGPDWLIHFEIE